MNTEFPYILYWIHFLESRDPFTEGYIGVTKRNPLFRFGEHSENRLRVNIEAGAVMTILHFGLSLDQALELEKKYRPQSYIGWNHAQGGKFKGLDDLSSTKLKGDARTPAQRESSNLHSERMKGRSPWNKGKRGVQKMSDKHRKIISEVNKKRSKVLVTCPHCALQGSGPTMVRWHFEKCRMKTEYTS